MGEASEWEWAPVPKQVQASLGVADPWVSQTGPPVLTSTLLAPTPGRVALALRLNQAVPVTY